MATLDEVKAQIAAVQMAAEQLKAQLATQPVPVATQADLDAMSANLSAAQSTIASMLTPAP